MAIDSGVNTGNPTDAIELLLYTNLQIQTSIIQPNSITIGTISPNSIAVGYINTNSLGINETTRICEWCKTVNDCNNKECYACGVILDCAETVNELKTMDIKIIDAEED